MAKPKMKTKPEAYIETRPGIRGGAAVVAGTGIKVLDGARGTAFPGKMRL